MEMNLEKSAIKRPFYASQVLGIKTAFPGLTRQWTAGAGSRQNLNACDSSVAGALNKWRSP